MKTGVQVAIGIASAAVVVGLVIYVLAATGVVTMLPISGY